MLFYGGKFMAFFDNLGKKITQASQSAVQKTKGITDIAKINAIISDEEKKINNNYSRLGKLYVAVHYSDSEPDFAEIVSDIKNSEQKIVELRQQIQDIKGIVLCEKCGAEVPNTDAFCSSCGNPMPKHKVPENLVRCVKCNNMVANDIRFCTKCGSPMELSHQYHQANQVTAENFSVAEQAPVSAPVQVQQPVAVTEPSVLANTCSNCNAPLAENAAFCAECGTPVVTDFANYQGNQDIGNANASVKRCPNCGAELPSIAAFCAECGTKLN